MAEMFSVRVRTAEGVKLVTYNAETAPILRRLLSENPIPKAVAAAANRLAEMFEMGLKSKGNTAAVIDRMQSDWQPSGDKIEGWECMSSVAQPTTYNSPVPDMIANAQALEAIRERMERDQWAILSKVLRDGYTVREVARQAKVPETVVEFRFRESLSALARVMRGLDRAGIL